MYICNLRFEVYGDFQVTLRLDDERHVRCIYNNNNFIQKMKTYLQYNI